MGVCGEHGGDPKSVAFSMSWAWIISVALLFVFPLHGLRRLRALRAEALKVAEASKNPSTDPEKSQGTPLDSSSDKSCLKDSIEERDLSLDNNP